jgi:2-dehydropantoate 2-reductase
MMRTGGAPSARILVLGAGATGGYFGGRLAEAGADVTFLLRDARRAQVARDGLRILSPLGDVTLPARTVGTADLRDDYDIVLLSCKAYDLESAIAAIAPAVTGPCTVVPLLNGMAHLDRLDAQFGPTQVTGGTCMIDGVLRSDGVVEHRGTLQRLVFGARHPAQGAALRSLAAALATTRLDWEYADNIKQRMWDKLSFLSALAATTSLFRANIGEIMAASGGRAAVERTYRANLEIAAREGFPVSDDVAKGAWQRLTDPAGDWTSSLARDEEAGFRTEADHIVGWMLDRARRHGIDDTMLDLAYTALKAYEVRRAAGRLPA